MPNIQFINSQIFHMARDNRIGYIRVANYWTNYEYILNCNAIEIIIPTLAKVWHYTLKKFLNILKNLGYQIIDYREPWTMLQHPQVRSYQSRL